MRSAGQLLGIGIGRSGFDTSVDTQQQGHGRRTRRGGAIAIQVLRQALIGDDHLQHALGEAGLFVEHVASLERTRQALGGCAGIKMRQQGVRRLPGHCRTRQHQGGRGHRSQNSHRVLPRGVRVATLTPNRLLADALEPFVLGNDLDAQILCGLELGPRPGSSDQDIGFRRYRARYLGA